MNISLGLFALALAAAVPQVQEAPEISYSVQAIKLTGLEWRGEFFNRLQPVASQGGATVWTTSVEAARKLAEKDPQGLKAPRVTSASQAVAHIFHRNNRKFASGARRLAFDPGDGVTQVAYTPSIEEVREGFAITLSGRKIDQGVLACVVLDETTVAAVHEVSLPCAGAAEGCCKPESGQAASRIEVPEIAHSSVAGEWLIPNDSVLVVSLGAQTKPDDQGKAVVVEHLMLIEARPIGVGDGSVARRPMTTAPSNFLATFSPTPGLHRLPARTATGEAIFWTPERSHPAAPKTPMPMPAMPSRSLPQARAADGSSIPLPPLPDTPPVPSSMPGSSEPCASPQVPNLRGEPPSMDSDSVQAGFVSGPNEKDEEAGAGESWKTRMFRIPLNFELKGAKIAVEIKVPQAWLFRNVGVGRSHVQDPPEHEGK